MPEEQDLRSTEPGAAVFGANRFEGLFRVSKSGRLLRANDAVTQILGFPSSDRLLAVGAGFPGRFAVDPVDCETFQRLLDEQGHIDGFDLRLSRFDRKTIWVRLWLDPESCGAGGDEFVGRLIDVSERHELEASLQCIERHYRQLQQTAQEGMWTFDSAGSTSYANRRMTDLLGYSADEMVGRSISEFLDEPLVSHDALFDHGRPGVELAACEVRLRRKDGGELWATVNASALHDADGRVIGTLALVADITDLKHAEQSLRASQERLMEAVCQLQGMASKDQLTGLDNRGTFDQRLDEEWRRASRSTSDLSLVLIDIDCFKLYNDSLGHPAGDECLRQVAQALSQCSQRPGDVVARYGGEEFGVILPGADSASAAKIAETTRSAVVSLRIAHPKSPVADHVTLSLGVASVVPGARVRVPSLVAAADKALYRAKSNGRDRVEIAEAVALD